MQLATETAVVQNINYFWPFIVGVNPDNPGRGLNPVANQSGAVGSANPGGTNLNVRHENQRRAYGADQATANSTADHFSDTYENHRTSVQDWSAVIIAWSSDSGPVDEQADCTALVDAIDRRIMDGRFKAVYPYDPSDDELSDTGFVDLDRDGKSDDYDGDGFPDPGSTIDLDGDGLVPDHDGINPGKTTTGDGDFTNDGELRNPREIIIDALVDMNYDHTTANGRRELFRFALYLMAATPEYLVQK